MMETEVLQLEDELLYHCAVADSAMTLYRERFDKALIDPKDELVVSIFTWTMDYIHAHKAAPTVEVLDFEFPSVSFNVPSAPVSYVIDKFRERHTRNEAQKVIKTLARSVNKDPIKAAQDGYQQLYALSRQTQKREHRLDLGDVDMLVEEYKRRVQLGMMFGVTFGFPEVDELLSGLRKGCLYYVIGRPKRYKSWFLLKSAVEAVRAGLRAAFFSLEMTEQEMMNRAVCMMAGVSWSHFVKGALMPDQMALLKSAAAMFEADSLVMLRPPAGQRTVPQIAEMANEIQADVVYIDQLKFLQSTRPVPADLRHREIEYINEEMKDACDLIPWYVAAQFNREAANLAEMADLAKIGLSDSIGQTADLLFGLHQTKDMRQSNIVEFGTIESRSFEHARWNIKVDLSTKADFRVIERIQD